MDLNLSLKCECGAIRAELTELHNGDWNRNVCYCDDCQAYAHYLGKAAKVLDAHGGTDIVAIAPNKFHFMQGVENLKAIRLSEKGMIRFYAGCCRSPIANSTPNDKIPHAGLFTTFIDLDDLALKEKVGPVRSRVQGKYGIGELPAGTAQVVSLRGIIEFLVFFARGFIRQSAKGTPFFRGGQPVVEPYVLTKSERNALRKFCGPNPSASDT